MAKNKDKEPKNKKKFFKDFKAELKKVIWPTPKQLVNSTAAVVVIVLITAAIVFALDFAFELLNKYGINRIKANVKGVVVEQNVDANSINENIIDENVVNEAIENGTTTTENNVTENSTTENNEETNNINE